MQGQWDSPSDRSGDVGQTWAAPQHCLVPWATPGVTPEYQVEITLEPPPDVTQKTSIRDDKYNSLDSSGVQDLSFWLQITYIIRMLWNFMAGTSKLKPIPIYYFLYNSRTNYWIQVVKQQQQNNPNGAQGPFAVPRMELRLATCKANAFPGVLSLWPPKMY